MTEIETSMDLKGSTINVWWNTSIEVRFWLVEAIKEKFLPMHTVNIKFGPYLLQKKSKMQKSQGSIDRFFQTYIKMI